MVVVGIGYGGLWCCSMMWILGNRGWLMRTEGRQETKGVFGVVGDSCGVGC